MQASTRQDFGIIKDARRVKVGKIQLLINEFSSLDKMTTNTLTTKSPLPQFACQSCGLFLQQDPSLETIDDQMTKNIGNIVLRTFSPYLIIRNISASGTAIGDDSYNEVQQGGVS